MTNYNNKKSYHMKVPVSDLDNLSSKQIQNKCNMYAVHVFKFPYTLA